MRRVLLVAAACASLVGGAVAQERAAPQSRQHSDFWFDPTQLPSFTGTVERYLLNPRGETDAWLFREGPQVVFPPDVADAVRNAAPVGRPIIVWGIRARHAPVITMLAFAANTDSVPGVVDRFYWRLGGRTAGDSAERVSAAGAVKVPYFAPQGEVAGAILDDGTVIAIPAGTSEQLRDLLRPGARLAAEGPGVATEGGRAIAADRIGENPENLRPVPAPDLQRRR